MSNQTNDELMDRASYVLEETQSHPSGYDKLLSAELNKEQPDLDQVEFYVCALEGALSMAEFLQNEVDFV